MVMINKIIIYSYIYFIIYVFIYLLIDILIYLLFHQVWFVL